MNKRRALISTVIAMAVTVAVAAPAVATTGSEDDTGPGSVVSAEKVAVPLPANATAISYRSTDAFDEPNVVTGIVLTPLLPPPGPLRLISYAAGTQGLADRCAPSRQLRAGTEYEAVPLSTLLAQGYAVALTDYEGLGTPGEHTYVNRASQAHAVLDVARAAQRLDVGIPQDGQVALAGYSQGGGASAAAAELAGEYAPELDVVGAYAGAVPADLGAVAPTLDGSPAAALLGYAVSGFDAAYPDLNIPGILNDRGRQTLDRLRGQCLPESLPQFVGARTETLTVDGRPVAEYLDEEPLRSRVSEQLIGTRTPEMPVLIVHSRFDDIVPFEQDATLARTWCENGATVDFRPTDVPTHVGAFPVAFAQAVPYLADRFAGREAPSSC